MMTRAGLSLPLALWLGFTLLHTGCGGPATFLDSYAGRPYGDSLRVAAAQTIPGLLECEWYDTGGEGVAYHDSDEANSGSGALNPIDGSYLHGFRADEAVDVSFTKSGGIDDTPYNLVPSETGRLYVGWTEPGEWTRYSVDVARSGRYSVGITYTSRYDGQIALSVDAEELTGPIDIPSTYVEADSIEWRQYHHWNRLDDLAIVSLEAGRHVLTLHTVATGKMNYDALRFVAVP